MGRRVWIVSWCLVAWAGWSCADQTGGDPDCGDGIRRGDEACDQQDLAGVSCVSADYDGGALGCKSDCTYDFSGCTGEGPTCGNSIGEGLEQCDGTDLRGTTCNIVGYDSGTLACAGGCVFDTSGCSGAPVCGDGNAEGILEECDDMDLRGLGCTDFGHTSGVLACDTGCRIVTGLCTGGTRSVCGNGTADGLEDCDANDLRGNGCIDLGYDSGTLACDPSCRYDARACVGTPADCGDGTKEGLEQCDLADLEGATCGTVMSGFGDLQCDASCTFDRTACFPLLPNNHLTAMGCEGVYNPNQLLTYNITMPAADWTALLLPQPSEIYSYYEAQFSCGGAATIRVGIRRKRSSGALKPGIKIDINRYDLGQRYYGLRRLTLEIGTSSGGISESAVKDILAEYLATRMHFLSGAIASRAALSRLVVNGDDIGVFVSVEQLDKSFLNHHMGNNDGWLFKKSGGPTDGYETNALRPNPYDVYFCFMPAEGLACPIPADLATTLPDNLNIDQILRMGGVNALMANTDAPLFIDNNYWFYDWPAKRLYLAWDLDTIMKTTYDVFTGPSGGPGGTTKFEDVLFPLWEDEYDQILTDLLANALTLTVINNELDRALSVAGAALDADPAVTGKPTSVAVAALKTYWAERHPEVVAQVAARP